MSEKTLEIVKKWVDECKRTPQIWEQKILENIIPDVTNKIKKTIAIKPYLTRGKRLSKSLTILILPVPKPTPIAIAIIKRRKVWIPIILLYYLLGNILVKIAPNDA